MKRVPTENRTTALRSMQNRVGEVPTKVEAQVAQKQCEFVRRRDGDLVVGLARDGDVRDRLL